MKKRYKGNALEILLGVVWFIEYFTNYSYGHQIKVITDYRALLSNIKETILINHTIVATTVG